MYRLSCVALVALMVQTVSATEKPNVIFFLVDDWGWKDAACLGSDLYETPQIDRLAREGMKFATTYAACTVCSPTRAAVMTGMYPGRTRVTDFITGGQPANAKLLRPAWMQRLEHRHTSLAEALHLNGYKTIHIGKWHLMPRGTPEMNDYLPQRHGFDINIAGNEWGAPGSYFHPFMSNRRKIGVLPPGGEKGDYLTDRLTDEALKILERNGSNPFFLYFPFYNVHTPLQGKPDLVAKYESRVREDGLHRNATYAAMVESVDTAIGRVRAKLEELDLADNTVIFLTGDNGGLDRKGRPTENAPLRAGKGSAYEGGVRVPGFALWPGVTRAGSRSDVPVVSCDFYPTILDITGSTGSEEHNQNVDGVTLTSLLRDPGATLDRRALYWHYPHYHSGGATPHSAVRDGDWRLIEFFEDMRTELYNLRDDPGETRDLSGSNLAKAQELRDRLQAWRKSVDAQLPLPNPAYDAAATKKKRRK